VVRGKTCTKCSIVDHANETGALCVDGEMDLSDCHVRLREVAVEGGTLSISSCKIEANEADGILLQGKGSAIILLEVAVGG
jgi:hypothetical protein